MQNTPKVSVVIPSYNSAKYITETIESILTSTYQDYEIVIVDDGSTDNTKKIVEDLKKRSDKIQYLYQTNKGLPAARNCGIKSAKGEYILPLDADDRISANYMDEAVQVLEQNNDIKIVYCEAEFFGDRTGKWELPPFSLKTISRKNIIFACSFYRKKDWKKAGGYSEEMTWGWEDWEFWLSILEHGGTAHQLPITGFYYRIHASSLRQGFNKEKKKKTIDFVNKKHQDFIFKYHNGPLRYQRKMSKAINIIIKLFSFGLKKW